MADGALADLRIIYHAINAHESEQARSWFDGLERLAFRLDMFPERGTLAPEDGRFRQLLYGRKPHIYRLIYRIDEAKMVVSVVHVRHGARDAWAADDDPGAP